MSSNLHFTFSIIFRLLLGVVFITAGLPKLISPTSFAILVAQYQLLPINWVNYFSIWLPAFEIIVGVGLIVTPWVKEFSICILFLLFIFIIALSQALIRDLGITCGCFSIEGAQDKKGAWIALLRDFLFLIPNIYLLLKTQSTFIWKRP